MATLDKRLESVVTGMSPEAKARLVIEDFLRPEPVLSDSERRKMLTTVTSEEGRRYNEFAERFDTLRRNLAALISMSHEIVRNLTERDRMLWYHRGLYDVVEGIIFSGASKALLTDNPNLKPGKPLEIRVTFGTVRLGVWGRKQRLPFGNQPLVEMNERVEAILSLYAEGIRQKAAELKALFNHVSQEAEAMELEFMAGMAIESLDEVIKYDKSVSDLAHEIQNRSSEFAEEGLSEDEIAERIIDEEPVSSGRCIFPVDDRWALEWDEIEEEPDTAESIRQDPKDWSLERFDEVIAEGLLERFKGVAVNQPR